MSSSELASQILSDMWEYGRIVLILVAVSATWGFIITKSEDSQERLNTQRWLVLIALSTVGVFAFLSFLNVQARNIVMLMRASPGWGYFTSAVVFSAVVVFGITAYRHFAAGRTEEAITITAVHEQISGVAITNSIKMSWMIVLLLLFASTIWLWRLTGR